MQQLRFTFLVSILIHILILVAVVFLLKPSILKKTSLHVDVTLQQPPPPVETEQGVTQTQTQIIEPDWNIAAVDSDKLPESAIPDSISLVRKIYPWEKPQEHAADALLLNQQTRDSLLSLQLKSWQNTMKEYALLKPPQNEALEQLKKQNDGSSPIFLTPPDPSQKPKKRNPVLFNFIPTREQLQAIAYLDKHRENTSQLDMYANLDTTVATTAEKFDRSLDHLVRKGFLSRKKISPQNILQVVTPIGGMPVELSPQNRRNPVYRYEIRVQKDKLIDYLQARLSQLRHRLQNAAGDPDSLNKKIKELEQKIQILL